MNAEDLLASVFPDQVACGENIVGDIVIPDHPLVKQTVSDCLDEAMDIEGFERLLEGLVSGRDRRRSLAISPSLRRSPSKCCRHVPMHISTMRRSKNVARRPS